MNFTASRKTGKRIGKWLVANWRNLIFWPAIIIWWGAAIYITELWVTAIIVIAGFQQWAKFCAWVEYKAPNKTQRTLAHLHNKYDDLVLLYILNSAEFQKLHPMFFKQPKKQETKGAK